MRIFCVLSTLLVVGCGSGTVEDLPDTGGTPPPTDSSRPGVDAGGGVDSSMPRPDTGMVTPPDGPMVDRTDPQLHEHELSPDAIDPAASDYLEPQFAQLDTRSEPLGKLVFFLPGANNTPRNWRDHGRKLAEFGFHVVIPHYNNAWGSACSGMGGDCNKNTRWEALTGEDLSSVIVASRADSAEGRVIRLLEHLTTAHPGGDWGYYLDGAGGLRYEQIIIAGISHGASSTGLYASRRGFWRAVMHSGGYSGIDTPPATPITEYYGFSHTEDPQHDGHLNSWENAGLPGTPTSIDGQTAPYGDTSRLITSEPNSYPHCSVAVGGSSPTDGGGAYIFEPAWRYLYGVAELP